MKKTKRILVAILVVVMVLSLFAGCTPKASTLVINVGPNPDTIDPALNSAVDGATLIIHAFAGVMGWEQKSNGALEIAEDCAKSYTESTDGLTYVFTLRDGLKWSDGVEVKASDFEYAWQRAANPATGSDYGYMFDVIDGYLAVESGVAGAKLNVVADDAAKTLTVKLSTRTPYFLELCAFPTYFPVRKDIVEANPDSWATKPETYIGNGPFTMVEWTVDSKIVFEKNANYHKAKDVKLAKIEFALTDDDNAMLANYNNGTYKFIDNVPNGEIDSLKKSKPGEFIISGQLGTYYTNFNINYDFSPAGKKLTQLEQAEVRKALILLIDRTNIVVNVGKAGQQEANSFVPIGLTDADTSKEFVELNGPEGKGGGYYSATDYAGNKAKALEILAKYFTVKDGKVTNFPSIEYLHNPGTGHVGVGVALQSDFQAVGINMTLASQEWNTFLNTRKSGQYVIARNGWLGDYNDPISFLDMWTTASGNNDVQYGKGDHKTAALYGPNHDKTWAETYDVLIAEIKNTSDPVKRFALMHQAENQLMETGAIIPLYFYTDIYMVSPSIKGFYASPLGYKFFMFSELVD